MTRDLRRRALESHKTISKKQQLRVASGTTSLTNSRSASRNVSRHGSDDEDGNMSDSTSWSVNSIDDMLDENAPEETNQAWDQELSDRIEELVNRKRSTNKGRETCLATYNYILMRHYAQDEIERKTGELFPALLKSTRDDAEEKEACLALRAIALTIITVPSDDAYDLILDSLKRIYTTSEHMAVKAAAIRTLSALTTYGGASDTEIENIMDILLEIIESDGNSIDAGDDAEVVAAACEEWGSLATWIDDLEEKSEAAMEVFIDQLESSSTLVQVAAGENIALIYEKSYSPREKDDDPVRDEDKYDEQGIRLDTNYVKRYEPFREKYKLEHTLSQLTKESSKTISKRDRKMIHANFADILNTVEHPYRGPKYNPAINEETGLRYGSRMTVRIHKSGFMKIEKWWMLLRLQALRRVLGGGFITHYESNSVILESLPAMITRKSY